MPFEVVQIITPSGKTDDVLKIDNTSSSSDISYTFGDILELDEEYTFSCWMRSDTLTSTDVYISEQHKIFEITNEWKHIEFTALAATTSSKEVRFTIPNGSVLYAYEGQLEIGNKASDFNQNPDDTENSIKEIYDKYASMKLDLEGFKVQVSDTYITKKEFDDEKIYKSTTPPDNPVDGMMWLDTSDVNNPVLYTYMQVDNTEDDTPVYDWVKSNYDEEIQRIKDSIENLTSEEWMVSITDKVLHSDEAEELVNESELSSKLQLLKDQLNLTLEQMSGYNLLLNSAGWNGTSFWEVGEAGKIDTVNDNDVVDSTVSGHAFKLYDGALMYQKIKITQGSSYTISCKFKKYMTNCYLKVIQGSQEDILFSYDESFTDEEWHDTSLTFKAIGKDAIIEIYSSDKYLMVSDLIINDGSIKKMWTAHTDEIYTTGVKIDKKGIQIEQSDTDTVTKIDSREFAIIDKVTKEKSLSVNRDTTKMNKMECASATIGNALFLPVELEDGDIGISITILD